MRSEFFRTASVTGGAFIKRAKTIEKSRSFKNKIIRHPNDDMDYMFIGGERVLFYKERLVTIDGELVPGVVLTDLWTDLSIEGIAKEGMVQFERGKKPEELIRRIIGLTTNEKDLVVDFFCGSGTTMAVAHKMKRQYIGIEQLDYDENDVVVRLRNVINGEQYGISKSVGWNGGGSFIYCELKMWNEAYMAEIQKADTSLKIINIYERMKREAFFHYNVDSSKFEQEEFEKLSLEEQKQVLCECLDKNHLYINLNEIDDTTYKVSEEDKKLNKEFYKTTA